MSRPFVALGSCPWKETPSKFGEPNYRANALRECQTYIQAIRNYLGYEPAGAKLETKLFDGDRGAFYEVVVGQCEVRFSKIASHKACTAFVRPSSKHRKNTHD